MHDEDFNTARALVEEHRERTDSTVAARVLDRVRARSGSWVKVMPIDYKRALREEAERRAAEAGEPAVIGERGNPGGRGRVEAGQPTPYPAGDGHQETVTTGEAGQHEDAAVAAARAGRDARA